MLLTRANSAPPPARGLTVGDFRQRLVDEPLVRLAVDGLAQQPRGRLDDEVGHLGAQLLNGTIALTTDLRLRAMEKRLGIATRLGTHILGLDDGVAVSPGDD